MTYDNNLEHVAEPASPSGRKRAIRADLGSFEALWFAQYLREYAHYGDHAEEHYADIASAYVEYIDMAVRDQGRNYVHLYVHTEDAAETLMDALFQVEAEDEVDEVLRSSVSGPIRDVYLAHFEGDVPDSDDEFDFEDGEN